MVVIVLPQIKHVISSGNGTLKADFFCTSGFSKPAAEELLFSDIFGEKVPEGTGTGLTRKMEGIPSDCQWIHMSIGTVPVG